MRCVLCRQKVDSSTFNNTLTDTHRPQNISNTEIAKIYNFSSLETKPSLGSAELDSMHGIVYLLRGAALSEVTVILIKLIKAIALPSETKMLLQQAISNTY